MTAEAPQIRPDLIEAMRDVEQPPWLCRSADARAAVTWLETPR